MNTKDEMRQAGIERETVNEQKLGDSSAKYWRSGSTLVTVYPRLRHPETARPFVVRLRAEHYIPINDIVYGEDEQEARERLLNALEWCVAHEYKPDNPYLRGRAESFLEQYKTGEMWLEIEELDIYSIIHCDWSSRGF